MTLNLIHVDDGQILGRDGKPIDPTKPMPASIVVPGDLPQSLLDQIATLPPSVQDVAPVIEPEPAVAPAPAVPSTTSQPGTYRCDRETWNKQYLDPFALVHLVAIALRDPAALADGFVITLSQDEYAKLPGEFRGHFRRVL
jgi:hypothetical protein